MDTKERMDTILKAAVNTKPSDLKKAKQPKKPSAK